MTRTSERADRAIARRARAPAAPDGVFRITSARSCSRRRTRTSRSAAAAAGIRTRPMRSRSAGSSIARRFRQPGRARARARTSRRKRGASSTIPRIRAAAGPSPMRNRSARDFATCSIDATDIAQTRARKPRPSPLRTTSKPAPTVCSTRSRRAARSRRASHRREAHRPADSARPASGQIVVLGMHRSGTSSVAGLLARMGAWPGEDSALLIGPDNPRGHYELAELHSACLRRLAAAGGDWKHPPTRGAGRGDRCVPPRSRGGARYARRAPAVVHQGTAPVPARARAAAAADAAGVRARRARSARSRRFARRARRARPRRCARALGALHARRIRRDARLAARASSTTPSSSPIRARSRCACMPISSHSAIEGLVAPDPVAISGLDRARPAPPARRRRRSFRAQPPRSASCSPRSRTAACSIAISRDTISPARSCIPARGRLSSRRCCPSCAPARHVRSRRARRCAIGSGSGRALALDFEAALAGECVALDLDGTFFADAPGRRRRQRALRVRVLSVRAHVGKRDAAPRTRRRAARACPARDPFRPGRRDARRARRRSGGEPHRADRTHGAVRRSIVPNAKSRSSYRSTMRRRWSSAVSIRCSSTRPARARLIVIDDASPNPAIAPLLARYASRANVSVLRNEANRGFTATANRGIAEAGERRCRAAQRRHRSRTELADRTSPRRGVRRRRRDGHRGFRQRRRVFGAGARTRKCVARAPGRSSTRRARCGTTPAPRIPSFRPATVSACTSAARSSTRSACSTKPRFRTATARKTISASARPRAACVI